MKALLRDVGITLLVAVAVFFLLQATVENSVVASSSMKPGLQVKERLLINKVVYHFHEPERGDIIVFHPPHKPEKTIPYIKRVIGLPSETVEVKDGAVYVNGAKLDEPYIKDPPRYILSQQKILENNYFVLGDNRNNSDDSHNGWTVPRDNIIGKAWVSIWPPDEWGLVPTYTYENS